MAAVVPRMRVPSTGVAVAAALAAAVRRSHRVVMFALEWEARDGRAAKRALPMTPTSKH